MFGQERERAVLRNKCADPLPKTGAVCPQWVRCGRPRCRCRRGELHGPYHYLFWREAGRLRKRYVRVADVAALQQACQQQREHARQEREHFRRGRDEWRRLQTRFREVMSDD